MSAYSLFGLVALTMSVAACAVGPNDPIPDFGQDGESQGVGTGSASEPSDDTAGTADDGSGSDETGGDETGDGTSDGESDGACGDGVIEADEQCDGTELGTMTCDSLGFDGGSLSCTDTCEYDTSACGGDGPVCGDGSTNGTEDCDGTDLGSNTCTAMGFEGGTLGCNGDCTFDTSGCTNDGPGCGNGSVDVGEQCDGLDLAGQTCISQGFAGGGILLCDASCSFDTSNCMGGGGGACTFDADCGGAQYCEDGTCYDGVVGDPCTFDSDCMSDICLTFDDVCSDGNAGDPCTFNSECMSGSCGVADVCD